MCLFTYHLLLLNFRFYVYPTNNFSSIISTLQCIQRFSFLSLETFGHLLSLITAFLILSGVLPFPRDSPSGDEWMAWERKDELWLVQNVYDGGSVVWGSSGKTEELRSVW